ncbi:MAG: DUF2199 domain-containing protein [Micrococcales bacterium]|nr:DUF2199 domain-containing protein [Micrococcales bacterium]
MTSPGWTCATCGARHDGLATLFGSDAPLPWILATEADRANGELNADLCFLELPDGQLFFIRGHLEIPVHDADIDTFVWSVWVSLSEQNMRRQHEHWDDPARAGLEPMFAWLMTALPVYEPTTTSLPARLHTRAPGVTPRIELDPSVDHPLVHEQHHGISLHRVAELNAMLSE